MRKNWQLTTNTIYMIKDALNGKKTYVICALALLVVFAHGLGYIDQPLRDGLLSVLGVGGFAALRHGISKVE